MGMANDMNPTDWGWKEENCQLIAVMTEKNAAPDIFLKVIHCNCLAECKSSQCAAADVMDFLVVQHVVHVKLKTVIIPTTLKTLIMRRMMTLKI